VDEEIRAHPNTYFKEFDAFNGPATPAVPRMIRVRISGRRESGEMLNLPRHFAICLLDAGRTSVFSSRTRRRKNIAFLARVVRITRVGAQGCPHRILSCPRRDLPRGLHIAA
jgi:hypothetical protein